MAEPERNKTKKVATEVSPAEHSAIVKAARAAGIPLSELVRILILFGLAKLESGDAELQRAVKGSRDAGLH